MKAVEKGAMTLLGYNNCLKLRCEDGKEYHVIDMFAEDFCKWGEDPKWPVEVVLIDERSVAIKDPRWANVKRKDQPCSMCSGYENWQEVQDGIKKNA